MTSAAKRLSSVSIFVIAAAAIALPATAQPLHGYLKIDDIMGESVNRKSGEQIEILSIQWGAAPAASRTVKGEVAGNEKITIHGNRTESNPAGRHTPPEVTLKRGKTAGASGDPDRPIVAGTVPTPFNPKEYSVSKDNNWGSAARTSPPAGKGSVWVRVATPWTGCRVGARYPSLELGDGGARYQLADAVITRCGADGAGLNFSKVSVRGWDPAKKAE